MRPLQSIAMGLVIVGLHATFNGYDALPDPVGWVLVLHGTSGLPPDLVRRGVVRALAVLAFLVSVPLWFPEVSRWLADLDAAIGWAFTLPQVGFLAVLADSLGRTAGDAGDTRARAWCRTLFVVFVIVGVLPVLIFGGGVTDLVAPAATVAVLSLVALVWLLFSWSARPWAAPRSHPQQPTPA